MSDDQKKRPNWLDSSASSEEDAALFRAFLEKDRIPNKDAHKDLFESDSSTDKPGKKVQKLGTISLDLHGKTASEATEEIDRYFSSLVVTLKNDQTVRVITGKGRHSTAGEGVLVRAVYEHVRLRWAPYIKRIDSPPAELLIQGLPVRGHFDVVLRRR